MRVGVVGFGNMGAALARTLRWKGDVVVYEIDRSRRESAAEEGFALAHDLYFLVRESDVIFVAVKPGDVGGVLEDIREFVEERIVVSIAAGVDLAALTSGLGSDRVVRLMPNLNLLVGRGAIAIAFGDGVKEEERERLKDLLSVCGTLYEIPESLFDSFTALAGSGPAFVFAFMDALAMAGVREGFSYETALRIAVDTVGGSAELLARLGGNPNEWITRVTSPGGTTVEGISYLERKGFRGTVIGCVRKTSRRARELKG